MKRLAVLLLMGLMALLLLTGCGGGGGGGDDDSQSVEERLVGSWRVTRLETEGQSTSCPGEINFTEDEAEVSVSCGPRDSIAFFSGGTFDGFGEGGGAYSGTWSLDGNTLVATITAPAQFAGTERQRLDFSGDNTFTAETEDNTTITFTRQ